MTETYAARHGLAMAGVTIEARSRHCEPGVCDLFLFPALEPDGALEPARCSR